jgi:hypothetical protein
VINLHRNEDPEFPISSGDMLDIYALYEIVKRRGRIEPERLAADLNVSKRIHELANSFDMEQQIIEDGYLLDSRDHNL